MTSTVVVEPKTSAETVSRLLVTVRDPQTRCYRSVGFLTDLAGTYRFAYLLSEVQREGFRPLPGLARAVSGPIESSDLFPVFAERVIAARRPDRETSLTALGLRADAGPFEFLARSHGQRVGDTIELLPAPSAVAGEPVEFTFLAHGVRYLPPANQDRITALEPGERLHLVPETENEVNPRAQVVTDSGEVRLGWLPDPLIAVVESLTDCSLVVERANGPEVGFHFRLLVALSGRMSANHEGLFSGPDWAT